MIDTEKWRPIAPSQAEYGEYALNQLIELRDKYKPDILWNDLGWPKSTKDQLYGVFAEFYHNNINGLVNDRWGLPKVRFSCPTHFKSIKRSNHMVNRRGVVILLHPSIQWLTRSKKNHSK